MVKQTKKVTLKPIGNRVMVQREAEKLSEGSILLPDTAKQKQERAKVIAVGEGKLGSDGRLIPIPVKVGDIILMEQYAGDVFSIDDDEYLFVKGDDIIAIVEN